MLKKLTGSKVYLFLVNAISQYATLILNNVLFLILANYLTAYDYGVLASVSILIGLLSILIEGGISSGVVASRDSFSNKDYSSLFYGSILISLIILLGLFILSNYLALRLRVSEVVIYVFLVKFFITTLSIIPRAILVKKFRFKEIAFADLISLLLSTIIALVLLIFIRNYWILIIKELVQIVITCVLCFFYSRFVPEFYLSKKSFNRIYKKSISSLWGSIMIFIAQNVDNYLIMRGMGLAQLGVYSKAYSLMLLPARNFSSVVNKTFFPIYSSIYVSSNKKAIFKSFLIKYDFFSVFFSVIFSFAYLISPYFFSAFFNESWSGISEVFGILCFAGIFISIYYLVPKLLLVIDTSIGYSVLLTISSSIYIASIFFASYYSIKIVSFAVLFSSLMTYLLYVYRVFDRLYIAKKLIFLNLTSNIFPFILVSFSSSLFLNRFFAILLFICFSSLYLLYVKKKTILRFYFFMKEKR